MHRDDTPSPEMSGYAETLQHGRQVVSPGEMRARDEIKIDFDIRTGPNKIHVLAFTGPKYSGKDTCAKRLGAHNSLRGLDLFRKLSFAAVPKQIAQMALGLTDDECNHTLMKERLLDRWPYDMPRQHMMDIPNWFRDNFGGDVWVRAWFRRLTYAAQLSPGCVWVITDLRFPEEIEFLGRLGATTVFVERPKARQALEASQAAGDAVALNPSEAHYDLLRRLAQYQISNDGDVMDLYNKVDELVKVMGYERLFEALPQASHHAIFNDLMGINESF